MAVLPVLTYPHPLLKQVSQPVAKVTDAVRAFIRDLEETMRCGPPSAGIAAPQVGRLERIVLIDVSMKPNIPHHGRVVLINPEIVEQSGKTKGREGCLSVPDFIGNVVRAKKTSIRALDESGAERIYHMEGYEARAAQHEMDHLDGKLFLDRLVSRRHDLFPRRREPDTE
ncbi:peptide deformylase [Nitrospina watsonii]|uniref:Peptide deformylase n=1 Tax=Nitrospina watsonii TaxID=1323948 RepID=A0ABM9HA37_9BACT|nr:peptide deformylase [Nitrospina watsonii]CAI2716990.1 Peptide deformylase [Nitrospina watsonii]